MPIVCFFSIEYLEYSENPRVIVWQAKVSALLCLWDLLQDRWFISVIHEQVFVGCAVA